MSSPPESISRLVELHRYDEARGALEEAETVRRPLLLVETYLHQGKVGAAALAIRNQLEVLGPGSENYRAVALYGKLLLVHHGRLRRAREEIRVMVERTRNDHGDFYRAFAADVHNRAEIMAITMGLATADRAESVSAETEAVANAYRALGETTRSLNARRRQADLWLREVGGNYARGERLLTSIIEEAEARGETITAGWAGLRRAEARLVAAWNAGGEGWREVLPEFDAAAVRLVAGGLTEGVRAVEVRFGELLLKLGIADGKEILEKAAGALPSERFLPLLDGAWSAYEVYCRRICDPEGTRRAARERRRTAAGIETPMSDNIADLAAADQAFREGRVAEARAQLERILADGDAYYNMATVSVLATVMGSINDRASALALLEEMAGRMRAYGPTAFLSQLYYVMMGQVMDEAPARALHYIELALAVDREIGDPRSESQHLGMRAWLMARERHLAAAAPVVTEEIEALFDRAVRLNEGFRDQEAREMLAGLCQHRAQAHLFGEDYDKAWRWYELARQVAEANQLISSLGTTLNNIGLAFVSIGRKGNPAAFTEAAKYADRAIALFEGSGLATMRQKSYFHRGLISDEAARYQGGDQSRVQELWAEATDYYERSARVMEEMRAAATAASGRGRTEDLTMFGADKQVFLGAALRFHLHYRRDGYLALRWLERMKGQALLDGLLRRDDAERVLEQSDILVDYGDLRDCLRREDERTGKRTLLVAYYSEPELTYAIGLRADWSTPAVERIPLPHQSFLSLVRHYFRRRDGVRTLLEDIGPEPWEGMRMLVGMLSWWSAPDDRIGLVPFGELHDLPLHTLPVDGAMLQERNTVFYAPSLAVWRAVVRGEKGGQRASELYVFGDPTGDLPAAGREAGRIADLAARTRVRSKLLSKEEVTAGSIEEALSRGVDIHYAGHADLAVTDGFASGLRLAGGERFPASALLKLRSASKLVVLSGCETGVSHRQAGDELFGLVHGLLYAGVDTVVVSQWAVQDDATAELLEAFYRELFRPEVAGPAEALRLAVRQQRERWPDRDFFYWGAFVVVGRG